MKLQFQREHISIKSFAPEGVELGQFTVITGLNGSGKSQLLDAIYAGHISNNIGASGAGLIAKFDASNFVVGNVGAVQAADMRQARKEAFIKFRRYVPELSAIKSTAQSFGIELSESMKDADIVALSEAELVRQLGNVDAVKNFRDSIIQAQQTHNNRYGMDYNSAVATLSPLAKSLDKDVDRLTKEDVEDYVLNTSNMTPFQMSFATMFDEYRVFMIANIVAESRAAKGENVHFLTNHEFILRHKSPPWDTLNAALTRANLPFTINAPDLNNARVPYIPKLTKIGTGTEIEFANLSSGERILMSLATAIYYDMDRRLQPQYPRLLLFDEIDAPLHPSMSRDMLNIILEILVGKQGLHVILTTHSPSTVALAPEDSIYTMENTQNRLRKASKAEALNLLTDGLPTLAISIDERRQVLVESPADVKVFSTLYEMLVPLLPAGRSLEFISTGTKDAVANSDQNTGVGNALRLLAGFVDARNQSVFALVDSDKGKNQPDRKKRIHVVANGKRDGLENCIYDPLIVLLLVVRHGRSHFDGIGIPRHTTDTALALMPAEELQNLVDIVQDYLLGERDKKTNVESVRYNGDFELLIRTDYLQIDDHALCTLVLEKIGAISKYGSDHAGERMRLIVDSEMRAHPRFIPKDLIDTFSDILNAPIHM